MAILESEFVSQYRQILRNNSVPEQNQRYYFKWINQYLDYCSKFAFNPIETHALDNFLQTLHVNHFLQRQATHAGKLYLMLNKPHKPEIQAKKPFIDKIKSIKPDLPNKSKQLKYLSKFKKKPSELEQENQATQTGAKSLYYPDTEQAWETLYEKLTNLIKVKHYSDKTLKSYKSWLKRFEKFIDSKDPAHLDQQDIVEFLSYLAVDEQISASSQNQAFNALLFVYKKCMQRKVAEIEGVVRAKHKPYIPVVLSRSEIEAIFRQLEPPYLLIVQLLYGCGLRLSECLNLRIQDLNLDTGILTIHDGKGKKDRTLPLPKSIYSELQQQIQTVYQIFQKDLKTGYDGVFLKHQLDKKYKNAAKTLQWQWLFPAKQLTKIPRTNQCRRYHLHESHVQRAIHQATQQAVILKRASAHTFRHSFASHLLQANYDIFTIQKMMGHSEARTPIYNRYSKLRFFGQPHYQRALVF